MDQQAPQKRTYRREDEWRQLVNEFESGDLSTAKFCAKYSIASSGLYTWRKKFQKEAIEAQEPIFVELPQRSISEERQGSQTRQWDVELDLGSNIILRIRKT